MKEQTVAKFVVCPNCGTHGRIRLSDGRESLEACAKDTAMKFAQVAFEAGWMSSIEILEVECQIQVSNMAESVEEADPFVLIATVIKQALQMDAVDTTTH